MKSTRQTIDYAGVMAMKMIKQDMTEDTILVQTIIEENRRLKNLHKKTHKLGNCMIER